ncbi:MAG: ribosomal protection-like ABC-F family protein [Patescibacteria group bacterium]|jgi:ATP-binding cassette subfamily F protein 3
MIKALNISFSYGEKPIFTKTSFTVGNNQKVGLVGPNGAGKSTLFNLLTQREFPEEGSITVDGIVELVPQEVKQDKVLEHAKTIRDYIDCGHQKQKYELLKILEGLELGNFKLEQKPLNLSGGQKTKLAIARVLILEPDILLLDEPTNFMDTAGKRWVMDFLSRYPKTVLLVSHDLPLINNSIDKVLAINIQYQTIEEYNGNYQTFQKLKKQRDELLRRQIQNEQKHIARMKESLVKMARFTSKKGVRQRTMLKKRIQKLEDTLPELPQEVKRIKLRLPEPSHIGQLPLMLKHISKSYGTNPVLTDVSLSVQRGERIALIGPNGAGKSTLIKVALGILEPDSGQINRNENLKIGYYSQEFEAFDMNLTLMQTMEEKAHLSEKLSRGVLARFMFPREKVNQRVGTLSGGEKTRLSIALLLLKVNNLLVLDEPTTYLDVMSQRVILDALKEYKGTMLVVSHTREFIEELKPSRALFLPQNRVAFWEPEMAKFVSRV